MITTFLSSSSSPDKLDVLKMKVGAVEHLLKDGNSLTAPEDIREFVRIFEGGDKDWLRGILKDLQREIVVEKEMVLAISQGAVESQAGMLRVGWEFTHGCRAPFRTSFFAKLFHDHHHATRYRYCNAQLPETIPPFPSSYLPSFVVEGATLSIPEEFNFNVASWEVGRFIDCSALSEAMRLYGGFPSTIFVREEMKAVWSILIDGIVTQQSKWALIGSPGVGKSILAVLLCFYLARDLGLPVFLARQLKGESGVRGEVAIRIEPSGQVVAYPAVFGDIFDIRYPFKVFGRQMEPGQRPIVVLDGWAQAEIVGTMQGTFGGFDLLATSAQYNPKSQDVHNLILLPAWKDDDLCTLWDRCRPKDVGSPTFEEQLYYSGGSARELLRPIANVRRRIDNTIARLDKATCGGLLSQRGGSSATGIDTLRRCYLATAGPEAYLEPSQRQYVVDSAYALNRFCTTAPLDVYESSLTIAKACGPVHYGLMFEALVHQLFRVPNMCTTFHVQQGALADVYESIDLGTDIKAECSGANEAGAMYHLGNLDVGTNQGTYWHPDFPRFSVVDAVFFATASKTVFYMQMTVAKEHEVNCEKLMAIHETAKKALEKSTGTEGWTYKYIAITQIFDQAVNLVLKDAGRVLSAQSVGEVAISKGYVTYAIK